MSVESTRYGRRRGAAASAEGGPGMTLVVLLAGTTLLAGALAAILLLAGAVLAEPLWLHVAWVAVAIALLEAAARRARARAREQFGEPVALLRLVERRAAGQRTLRALLLSWAVLLLAVASARPQWGIGEEDVRRTGVDVWALVDTSKSMLAEDMRPNRLARAKLALTSFVDRLGTDRIGLIAFAGEARVVCPLTMDHGAVKLFLDLLDPDVLQKPGTAIGTALDLARRSSDAASGRSVAVVLLTDGEDHGGEAVEIAGELAKAGIVVHAVGIGRAEGVPIPVEGTGGASHGWLKDGSGQTVMSRLDVAGLQRITQATGGRFFQVSSSEIELAAIASEIENMDQREFASTRARIRVDRAWPFMAAAFALLALELLVPDGARLLGRRDPVPAPSARVVAGGVS